MAASALSLKITLLSWAVEVTCGAQLSHDDLMPFLPVSSHLAIITHQPLCYSVHLDNVSVVVVEALLLRDTGWKTASSAIPAEPGKFQQAFVPIQGLYSEPEPRSRAVADSFLNSLAAEPAAASTIGGAMLSL